MGRNFITVLESMIDAMPKFDIRGSEKFKIKLQNIIKDSNFTAPEVLWEIRGSDVSSLLDEFIADNLEIPGWFVKILSIFTLVSECELLSNLPKGHIIVDDID